MLQEKDMKKDLPLTVYISVFCEVNLKQVSRFIDIAWEIVCIPTCISDEQFG